MALELNLPFRVGDLVCVKKDRRTLMGLRICSISTLTLFLIN